MELSVKINHEILKNVVVSHKSVDRAILKSKKKRSLVNWKRTSIGRVLLKTLLLMVSLIDLWWCRRIGAVLPIYLEQNQPSKMNGELDQKLKCCNS